jgi:hypothetical protein
VIPGGGIVRAEGKDGKSSSSWVSAKSPNFFVHVKPLSRLFKAKLRHELRRSGFFQEIPSSVWKKENDWVVHIQSAGTGKDVVKYLAPYVFRTALSNKRIVGLNGGNVTFKFKKRGSKKWSYQTLEAVDFIRRFMKHVLPRGLVKVRYYGFLAPNKRKDLARIKEGLEEKGDGDGMQAGATPVDGLGKEPERDPSKETSGSKKKPMTCPHCGGELMWVADLPKAWAPP